MAKQAATAPDAIVLVADDQMLSYRELNRRASQVAHCLHALGVGPNVLVRLCIERSLDMVVGLLGILKAGGSYVPLDPTYPSERLVAHQSQGDTGAFHEDDEEHAVVEDSLYSESLVGRRAIMERKDMGMAAIPDLNITITNRVAQGNQVSAG